MYIFIYIWGFVYIGSFYQNVCMVQDFRRIILQYEIHDPYFYKYFLYLVNQGVDIVRIDAVPYIWKELGTNCRNLKQVYFL